MYDNYLTDIDEYRSLEKFISNHFDEKFNTSEWEVSFFNTTFVNGKPFQNGNPIFSARHSKKKFIIKLIIDEDYDDEISDYETTFDDIQMYVFVTGVMKIEKSIKLFFDKVSEYL